MANGFLQNLDGSVLRRIQVLEEARGWHAVLNSFRSDHLVEMERNTNRFMVLLIDFDRKEERLREATARIPDHVRDRVFILGARSEPEALKRVNLGSYEDIGFAMAQDCREQTNRIWGHELLRHNAAEIERLRERVRPILFPT